jgi:DNA ligase (NAD+)
MQYDNQEQRALTERSKSLLAEPTATLSDSATAQMRDLENVLRFHEWRYYVQNEPLVSDYEYDILFNKLKALEQQFPELVSNTSPTKRVGSDLIGDFQSVEHLTPMLSLENSYNIDDLNDFDRRVREKANINADEPIQYVVEPKFDGGTITLVYENDQLVRAATRGNGVSGDDITHNAKAIRSIPIKAAFSKHGIYKVELRGEALIKKDTFEKLNESRQQQGLSLLANPRNAATGVMRVKNSQEVIDRGLEAFVYQLGYAVDMDGNDRLSSFENHHDTIELLRLLGFKVPTEESKVCQDIAEVNAFINGWELRRDDYQYEIDGMVIKVNKIATQNLCGYTSHHPRWAVAYKFKARQATSKLLHIEYQVGRMGAVTPVAKIQPVPLAGVMISSISLHNAGIIQEKDIRIGDTVLVERAGDVIPYIVKAMEDLRDGTEQPIIFPTHCPACAAELQKPENEAIWRCENPFCEAQIVEGFKHFVSKRAMDIDGLGEKQIEKFYAEGMIKSIADIYRLDFDKISKMEGFGKRSVEKMQQAIENSKKNPIYRLLYSFGVRHIGETVSKTFAAEVTKLQDLKDFTEEQLLALKDIGPKVSAAVLAFFSNEKNIALINELESLGVNTTRLEAERRDRNVVEGGILSGKTILFTGKLFLMTREAAELEAQKLGAKVASGVSSALSILVVGEKAGSKLAKAKQLGTVQIMSEQEFADLLKG